MTSVVDRVASLIRLSASPEIEEARTAAQQACRLIREHQLVVVLPSVEGGYRAAWGSAPPPPRPPPPPPRPPPPPPPPPEPRGRGSEPVWNECSRGQHSVQGEAMHETDRAILFESDDLPFNSQTQKRNGWVPKSQIWAGSEVKKRGDSGYLTVTDWFAQKAGWGPSRD